jgi:1-deoxy-D-xylulose-5-phosphate reductoisomerase
MKNIAILGSTGCVGKKTLEVIDRFPDEMRAFAISCHTNTELLKKQIKEYSPQFISVTHPEKVKDFPSAISMEEMVTHPEVNLVVIAIEGFSAVSFAFIAANAGKDIAIASKEILVCAGEAFMSLCREKNVTVFTLDHEQSALEQCLLGEDLEEVQQLILTASGGAFFQKEEENEFSVFEAMTHPNHHCGKKVAINCSTMMNKGLEVIETFHFFGVEKEKIDVVIHPQSLVQSLVSFKDGAYKAVISEPDLTFPLQYALLGRKRKSGSGKKLSFKQRVNLEFYPKDLAKFRCLKLSFDSLMAGGCYPAYLHAANEVLVERFCKGSVTWRGIGETLEQLLNRHQVSSEISLQAVIETNNKARKDAWEIK